MSRRDSHFERPITSFSGNKLDSVALNSTVVTVALERRGGKFYGFRQTHLLIWRAKRLFGHVANGVLLGLDYRFEPVKIRNNHFWVCLDFWLGFGNIAYAD